MRKPGFLHGKKGVLACFLALLLTSTGFAAEPAFVELVPPKESSPWVGQRTDFAVEVAVEGRFSGSTLFDLPQVPGVILMKPEERPVLSTRTIDDREYSVQRHEFSLFCQHDADIRIPEIRVRCGSIKSVGESPSQHVLRVPTFKVTPRLPEGARPGQVVVTTTRLEVSEAWNPRPGDAKVGDAFRRTVTLRAADVPGILLPQIPKSQLEGLALYSSVPGVNDRMERGEFTGKRVDTLTYVCERSGTIEIPPVLYRWWNPVKSAWEEQSLPAVALSIAPNPNDAHKESTGESPVVPTARGYWWWVFALAVAAVVCIFVPRRRKPDAETQAFREVLRACRNNDAGGTYNAVTRWRFLAAPYVDVPPVEVREELVSAQRVIAGLEPSWNGRKLEKSLKSWRHGARRRRSLLPGAGRLPELNPGGRRSEGGRGGMAI